MWRHSRNANGCAEGTHSCCVFFPIVGKAFVARYCEFRQKRWQGRKRLGSQGNHPVLKQTDHFAVWHAGEKRLAICHCI